MKHGIPNGIGECLECQIVSFQHVWKLTSQLMDYQEFQLLEIHFAKQDQLSKNKKPKIK